MASSYVSLLGRALLTLWHGNQPKLLRAQPCSLLGLKPPRTSNSPCSSSRTARPAASCSSLLHATPLSATAHSLHSSWYTDVTALRIVEGTCLTASSLRSSLLRGKAIHSRTHSLVRDILFRMFQLKSTSGPFHHMK